MTLKAYWPPESLMRDYNIPFTISKKDYTPSHNRLL